MPGSTGLLGLVTQNIGERTLLGAVSSVWDWGRRHLGGFKVLPVAKQLEAGVRVTESIGRAMASADDDVVVARGLLGTLASGLEACLDLSELLAAVVDGPVAARPTDNLELLQQSTLVPLKTNLGNLALAVEGDKVRLGREAPG